MIRILKKDPPHKILIETPLDDFRGIISRNRGKALEKVLPVADSAAQEGNEALFGDF